MALATYSNIKTALAQALRRPGDSTIASLAPDMIRLAETGIIYGIEPNDLSPFRAPPVRMRFMITRNPSFSVTSEYTELPSGFLEFRKAPIVATDPVTRIKMVSPDHMNDIEAGSDTYASGDVLFGCIEGTQLRLRPAPSSLTLDISHYTLSVLSDSNTTNTLLTNAPNVYLYGTARECAEHLGDFEAAKWWHGKYLGIVIAVQKADERGVQSLGVPEMRVLGRVY